MANKTGFFGKIAKFFRQVKAELKKVNWPNREELSKNTAIVVITIAAMTAFIGIADLVLGGLLTPLIM